LVGGGLSGHAVEQNFAAMNHWSWSCGKHRVCKEMCKRPWGSLLTLYQAVKIIFYADLDEYCTDEMSQTKNPEANPSPATASQHLRMYKWHEQMTMNLIGMYITKLVSVNNHCYILHPHTTPLTPLR